MAGSTAHLSELLHSPEGTEEKALLLDLMTKCMCLENYSFWRAVETYRDEYAIVDKQTHPAYAKMVEDAQLNWELFFATDSEQQVAMPAEVCRNIHKNIKSQIIGPDTFDVAQKETFSIIHRDIYQIFIKVCIQFLK